MKKCLAILLTTFFLSIPSVFAKDTFYTNNYGVEFTEEEYNFISMFYFEGYQDYMNQERYESFIESDIMNGNIQTVSSEDIPNITPYATMHETNAKVIKISSSCDTECTVSTTLTWKNTPTVKSYDVIGAYLKGATYKNDTLLTILATSSTTQFPSDNIIKSNGVATSMKLPNDSTGLKINQSFETSRSGTVNSSYQHAKRTSTSAKSKQFSFSEAGFGKVFLFNDSVKDYYDAMGGVSLNLN